MKLEEAEKIVKHCGKGSRECSSCIANDECGSGPWMYFEALEVVTAAREARIAELEDKWREDGRMHKDVVERLEHWINQLSSLDYSLQVAEMERDEARKDAVEMADTLKMTFETIHQLEKSRSELSDNYVYKRCIEISKRYSK